MKNTAYRLKYTTATGPGKGKSSYLKGPSDPAFVKYHGYSFTDNEDEAWPFPTLKQAQNKARILHLHMAAGDPNPGPWTNWVQVIPPAE